MIPLINGISERWFTYMGSAAFQATLLAFFVLAVLRVGRRWPPALRHAILMLAMCKFLIPPMLSLPTGVFSRIRPQEWFQSEPVRRYAAPTLHYAIPHLQAIKSSAQHASSVKNSLNKQPDSGTIGILPIPKPSLTTKGKLLVLHFSGLLIILSLAALQQLYLRRVVLRASRATDPMLLEIYDALCRNMHLRRRPHLRISAENHAPVTFGIWKPVVILPRAMIMALSPEEIRVILGHELAHQRRWDPWFLRLHLFVSAIWWFNPVYWLLSRTVRGVREDCCDDMVVAAGIASRERYCQTLLHAARVTCGCPVMGAVLAYFNELRPLHRRFNRIMTAKSIVFPKLAGWGLLAVSVLALLLLPGIKSPVLAHNSVREAVYPQRSNMALPELAAVMQTAAGSLKTRSAAPEGNRDSHAFASKPQARSAPENSIPPHFRKWLEEDVAYIMSLAERSAFQNLTNDEEREVFIEHFWARRNPDPRSPDNSFKQEHYRRIAYANQMFASGSPGWKTDRGRIYIMYGMPDKIESHPKGGSYLKPSNEGGGTVSTYPFEDWWYRHIAGVGDDIEIEFVDKSKSGEYKLAMNPDEKAVHPLILNLHMTAIAIEPTQVIAEFRQRYASIEGVRGNFQQTYQAPGIRQVEAGEFWLKKPGLMRFEYSSPAGQVFVADGAQSFFYVPKDRQVIVKPLSAADLHNIPLEFLLGSGNISQSFSASWETEFKPNSEHTRLIRLTPRQAEQEYSYLVLELGSKTLDIRLIVLRESAGSTTEFLFSNITAAAKMESELFQLNVPKGIEVIRLNNKQ